MKKYPIGFSAGTTDNPNKEASAASLKETKEPKKSVVQVYFPHRGTGWAYYNDSFDLKVGDFVYVEGKLEGYRGQVTEVNYSFRIKLSDYKKVIAVVDTDVKGEFCFAGSHLVTFDRNAIPFKKVLTWFRAPESKEEFESGNDDSKVFPLDDLSKMNIKGDVADCGHSYYIENRVSYVCVDGTHGYAIVEGSKNYDVEFSYVNGEISNLTCSCFCSGTCKHEFAAMLQLKEALDFITKNYEPYYDDYFAAIAKGVFMNTVMSKKDTGKIKIEF